MSKAQTCIDQAKVSGGCQRFDEFTNLVGGTNQLLENFVEITIFERIWWRINNKDFDSLPLKRTTKADETKRNSTKFATKSDWPSRKKKVTFVHTQHPQWCYIQELLKNYVFALSSTTEKIWYVTLIKSLFELQKFAMIVDEVTAFFSSLIALPHCFLCRWHTRSLASCVLTRSNRHLKSHVFCWKNNKKLEKLEYF